MKRICMSRVRGLCVLDVDGTLIEEEVIDLLGRQAACEQEVAKLTAQAMQGKLDFESSLRKRVSLLQGLSVSVFNQVYSQVHFSKNVQDFIKILQEHGIVCGLVSGGFTQIVGKLAHDLGINSFVANQLEVKDGILTGNLVGDVVTAQVKEETLKSWARQLELPLDKTIVVGDGANDLYMLKSAGIGIAFCAKDILKKEIPLQIEERDFTKVLELIDFF